MTDPDARARSQNLIEQLGTRWRVTEPERPASRSLRNRLLAPLLKLRARLLGPQEIVNSLALQYILNSVRPLELTIDEYKSARDDVQRFREALAARERRMEAAMAAMRNEHEEMRTALGVL